MSKNEKIEIKSWGEEQLKEKQTNVNKKRRNDNKLPEEEEEEGREAEDISKTFPNFCVLTKEERVAFFQALTTARKNVENKGVLTRKCFGTVHDEYLKYFDESDESEEDKEEENRSIRSSFTLRDNGSNCCSYQSEVQVDQKVDCGSPKEEKCLSSIFFFRDITETPRSSNTDTSEMNFWEQCQSLIQTEVNKVVDLFLKKKKRKIADSLQYGGTFEKDGSENKNWIALRFSRELDTPKFDALNPEEKQVFFKILQDAYDNVLQQNPNGDFQILPLNAILRKYQGCNEIATVFANKKDSFTSTCGEPKKDLKVSASMTSKDSEKMVGKSKKINIESPHPVEVESCCQSLQVVQGAGKVLSETSFAECRTPEREILSDESCKDSLKVPKPSLKIKQIKVCGNETANDKKNQLKKGGKEKKSECREHGQEITDLSSVGSAEKESTARKASLVQLIEKNSGKTEEVDCRSLLSTSEKTFEENAKSQSSFYTEKTKAEPEERCNGSSVAVTRQEPEKNERKTETAMPLKQKTKWLKKLSFVCNSPEKGSSELLNEGSENERNESEDGQGSMGGEVLKERSSTEDAPEDAPGTEARDCSLNRVILVNDDAVENLKRLIQFLGEKANKDGHLEKEYLKLLVDYAEYLSKVLESLILEKEKRQSQQRNAHEASEFRRFCDDSQRKSEAKCKSTEPECPLCSSRKPDNEKKHLRFAVMEETIQKTVKEPDRESESNLPVLSDSESLGSEGENRFKYRKDGRERILPTKIQLQDVLRQRAEFVEGDFDHFKVIQFPQEKFVPVEKPPTVKLLEEDHTKWRKYQKKKFLKFFVRFIPCGKKNKRTTEDELMENLKGEACRGTKRTRLRQATLEVLKAIERKKTMDKYFTHS